ncbi:TIGR02453 family protein [Mameliella sediminis]|uniref:TIGR02453 family protein n=1 Tax=Mameliella sediminis TaxID=2836866 RepID=UPI001C48E2B7|nr:TIGR02453 family protein [Mameliella sediminis]MBV7396500.1 TIGR02453 family protein [Mameliella sediminis]MBY6116834.1 TIGR02453 family protein [Antarctobacter heliothermus]MBY6146587.1 TIGR02453 family protein [Mameliella alba]MCA0956271.1 TIGR02453 family protein [Mameliella alba]
MADPVDPNRLLTDTRVFLTELADNNDRAWFRENKSRYDSELKRPAEKLLAQMAGWLAAKRGPVPRTKLFRPHRDVRFSEDKTPYHTHLHMMWSLPDGRAWMLGISTEYATAGAGLMHFEAAQMDRWREAIATNRGENLSRMIEAAGWRVDPPALKRVPAPYPADHPQEALLRCKGFVAWRDGLDQPLAVDPEETLKQVFTGFEPLMDWLGEIA